MRKASIIRFSKSVEAAAYQLLPKLIITLKNDLN